MNQDRIAEHRRRTWYCLGAIWVLLIVAGLAPVLAGLGVLRPPAEHAAIWFQRSGSVATVMALLGGLVIPYTYNKLHVPGTWGEDEGLQVLGEFKMSFKSGECVAFAITVAGTVVWGYGDLLWNAIAAS
ncbi:hypothetical protein RWG76_001138 [Pseudomonas aeruginosa]|nr:hypothetical protein [Pseudomonas aeruginosa]ELL1154953.1 hypothetical protein [Pseudomonas aeruginosa]